MMKKLSLWLALVLILNALGACGGPAPVESVNQPEPAIEQSESANTPSESAEGSSAVVVEQTDPVTIRWWHIQTQENEATAWQELADQYMAENPNVTIEITVLENEAFKQRLTTVMQAGDPPDLFQSWGGGVLWEFAQAGLLSDIAPAMTDEWRASFAAQSALNLFSREGEQYGAPWRWGAVGLFVNWSLFEQAGLERNSCPATWTEYLEAVQALKDAGITPIALGEGDKWPGHFWWVYLAIRTGGEDAFLAAYNRDGAFTDEPFVQAGVLLQELMALEPFPDGFLGLSYGDQASLFGNQLAAMELMGQWGPSVALANASEEMIIADEDLGWCPFPIVEGGTGHSDDVLGGGDGFALGLNAPPQTADFLQFLTSETGQRRIAQEGMTPITITGLDDTVDSEWLGEIVGARDNAPYSQLYYDQFLPPAVGLAVVDAVELLFAGVSSPEEIAELIEQAAQRELD